MKDNTIDNQQERLHFKIGYILGLIDGEGHLGLSSYKQRNGKINYYPILQVECTNREIIELFSNYFRDFGLSVYLYEVKPRKNYKGSLRFTIKGFKRLNKVLEFLLKYDFAKKNQAKVLKEFIDYRMSKDKNYKYSEIEKTLKDKITNLNQRGSAISSETTRQTA